MFHQCAAHNDQRVFRVLELVRECALAHDEGRSAPSRFSPGQAQVVVSVSGVRVPANERDLNGGCAAGSCGWAS